MGGFWVLGGCFLCFRWVDFWWIWVFGGWVLSFGWLGFRWVVLDFSRWVLVLGGCVLVLVGGF